MCQISFIACVLRSVTVLQNSKHWLNHTHVFYPLIPRRDQRLSLLQSIQSVKRHDDSVRLRLEVTIVSLTPTVSLLTQTWEVDRSAIR